MITDVDQPPTKQRKPFKRKANSRADILTPKQHAFVSAYLSNGGNGVAAAREAGYTKSKGTVSLAVCAVQVLKLIKVKNAITEHYRAAHMSPDEVVARLEEQARANPSQFFDSRWRINRKQMERNGHLVKKLKVPTGSGKNRKPAEIELHDGQAALVKIGMHLGLFQERLSVVGDASQPIRHEFTVHVSPGKVDATGPKQIVDAEVVKEGKP